MTPFHCVSGAAAPMTTPNIDTDVIMPKMFLKGVDRSGLGDGAFNLLRFSAGRPNPDFVLNRDGYRDARFLVVGPNFGCGSSREHAVWGLQQLGIRALIGTTFAGIFNDNCANNGLLTIRLDAATIGTLADIVANPASNKLTVDLEQQTIRIEGGGTIPFAIEPARKEAFLTGRDAISSTLVFADDIRVFEARHRADNPWF
ncbi:3-isopropylmalate dehydratase small subunit [Bradyrhizobium sp. CIAT3101]|uniref:3-isopropylmalate dehydratase small subunit n=1 Tax=Bradyrhizobium sp. CIAT3101 TaxID=439387 RepID=UPI0024B0696E|nr:3-isopropylmalate dehydratase small subunit [Bradyrhizobium sp. CIAT3101]WFU79308.1 3-isopropylmalate dehydratase small subunit [Bradyrhizobium sp. CIAT3101]